MNTMNVHKMPNRAPCHILQAIRCLEGTRRRKTRDKKEVPFSRGHGDVGENRATSPPNKASSSGSTLKGVATCPSGGTRRTSLVAATSLPKGSAGVAIRSRTLRWFKELVSKLQRGLVVRCCSSWFKRDTPTLEVPSMCVCYGAIERNGSFRG